MPFRDEGGPAPPRAPALPVSDGLGRAMSAGANFRWCKALRPRKPARSTRKKAPPEGGRGKILGEIQQFIDPSADILLADYRPFIGSLRHGGGMGGKASASGRKGGPYDPQPRVSRAR